MKAALYRTHGDASVLEYVEAADPVAGPGEVLVAVAAVGLNRMDLLQREGPGMMPGFELPHIAGMDVAGTVVAVGSDVATARIGERVVVNPAISCGRCPACLRGAGEFCTDREVIGASRPGGYGSLCTVPSTHAIAVPDHVDLVEAAAVPTIYSLAWHGLFTTGHLAIGETVLIHAAGSGVTTAAVHLAKRAGARVIVTSIVAAEREHAQAHGADEFIDTTTTDVVDAVLDLTGGRGVDMVFDHLGPALFSESIRSLRPLGRLVFCGTTTGAVVPVLLPEVYRNGIALLGAGGYTFEEFTQMLDFCWEARLPSIVDRVLPIAEIRQAHELMAAGTLRGKLVLTHEPTP